MALFFECMEQCAQKVLDTADIVRDGDLSTLMLPSDFAPQSRSCCQPILIKD
jgi:hypothetical protein